MNQISDTTSEELMQHIFDKTFSSFTNKEIEEETKKRLENSEIFYKILAFVKEHGSISGLDIIILSTKK